MTSNSKSKWWQKAVIYQIYPRSYKDSTGNGIGDLKGIISKLDYLEDLGIDAIWFSPFYPSPQLDHGYDIADYRSIDPVYGKMDDFELLLNEMHSRGIKMILDLVLNHSSSQHPWFVESASSKENPKRDWYIWRDGQKSNGKKPPNNWKSMTGGPAWRYYENTDQWVYFHFLPFQPDLNYRNPEVKKEMFDTTRFWLDKGVDGFRLDIFHTLYEFENLKDNPFSLKLLPSDDNFSYLFQNHLYDAHLPETIDFAIELRNLVNEYSNPERCLIGEIEGSLNTMKKYYGPNNNGLNMVFLFEFTSTNFKAEDFKSIIQKINVKFPFPYTPTWVLGNHDRIRYISRIDNNLPKARILATMQLTLRGTAFIYYGEEIGMKDVKFTLRSSKDPIGRQFWWLPISRLKQMGFSLTRDGCRTPMQWNSSPNAEFSSNENAQPWLKVAKDFEKVNVAEEKGDKKSLLYCYKQLLKIRKKNIALQEGSLNFMNNKELSDCLAYIREHSDQQIYIYLNFSAKSVKINLPKKGMKILFSTIPKRNNIKNSDMERDFTLVGYEGILLKSPRPN
ncbi:MAG: alpha-glucosidase [Promethearchaeota archaeon]|nr:MAG: alpha-glucosidase [Candidatus Lokiarchaeota archaeon]